MEAPPTISNLLAEVTVPQVGACWVFRSSAYHLHLLSLAQPHPHPRIASEHPIMYFTVVRDGKGGLFLLVANTRGCWSAYSVTGAERQLKMEKISQASLGDAGTRVVGVHLIDEQKSMLLFVGGDGSLEYNYLQGTRPLNRPYQLQEADSKYHKSNLYHRLKGRDLLQAQNQGRVLLTAYKANTRQLVVGSQDSSTGVCSVFKFFLQQYEVMTGFDFILNLPAVPLQIVPLGKAIVLNLGERILVWTNGTTVPVGLPADFYCSRLTQPEVNREELRCCGVGREGNQAYSLLLSYDQKSLQVQVKKQSAFKADDIALYFTSPSADKSHPVFALTSRLQIITVPAPQQSPKMLLANLNQTVLSAQLHTGPQSSYLQLRKQVGMQVQHLIVSHSRMFTSVQRYEHNMLLKMANVLGWVVGKGSVGLYLSSPIVGTLKLGIGIQGAVGGKADARIQKQGLEHRNLLTEEESLDFSAKRARQITQTQINTPKYTKQIKDLFDGKVQSIQAACSVGPYILLLVQRQVHVFTGEPNFKRAHLFCFDEEVKALLALNDVNSWGALLWDGSFWVMRIHQKQSVKVEQFETESSTKHFSFEASVNTVPNQFTLLSNKLLIVSNDALLAYQPEKTTLAILDLPQQIEGSQFYNTVDLSARSSDRYHILTRKHNRWKLIMFQNKYLLKKADQIKLQIEELLAFPDMEGLLMCVVLDSTFLLLGVNRILVGSSQTGSVCYKIQEKFTTVPSLCSTSQPATQYLRAWIQAKEVTHQKISFPDSPEISVTHPNIIRMSDQRILLYGEKDIWYASLEGHRAKPISYFSISNDAFIQFRNNLSIHQLENQQFMEMFADKLPIMGVARMSELLFAVLYPKMVCIVEIRSNGSLSIRQELPFRECQGLISIAEIIGAYDERSLYMKDTSHRLVFMKYSEEKQAYVLEIQEIMEDQVVSMFKVRGWSERMRKTGPQQAEKPPEEQMVVRRDGQLLVGAGNKAVYI